MSKWERFPQGSWAISPEFRPLSVISKDINPSCLPYVRAEMLAASDGQGSLFPPRTGKELCPALRQAPDAGPPIRGVVHIEELISQRKTPRLGELEGAVPW